MRSQHAVLQNSVGGRDLGDYFDRLGDSIVTVRTLGKRRSGTPMPVPAREFVGPVGLEPTTYGLKVRSSAN